MKPTQAEVEALITRLGGYNPPDRCCSDNERMTAIDIHAAAAMLRALSAPAPAATGDDAELCKRLRHNVSADGIMSLQLVAAARIEALAGERDVWHEKWRGEIELNKRLAAEVARIKRDADESNRILGDECERLRARAEAAEKDAARYRHIRDRPTFNDGVTLIVAVHESVKTGDVTGDSAIVDAAIDAAIASAKEGT